MAKLYFKFGAMGSSKTAQALMTKFNYEEKGKHVLLIKPATDDRDDSRDADGSVRTMVRSRIGLSAEALAVDGDEDIRSLFQRRHALSPLDVLICDECQFLTPAQVDQMKDLADLDDVPVLCFGLRADFQTKLFPGSKRLFEIADSITEIKYVCRCGRKAVVNARFDDSGVILVEGDQICIGGNDRYEGMCYKCYRALIRDRGRKIIH
jgi:thymidine kinase